VKAIPAQHRGTLATAPRIALIAHNAKKEELLHLLADFLPVLEGCSLVATKTTGALLAHRLGLQVRLLHSGPMGGDLQVGALVAQGELDAVVFLRDPLTAQPHEPDISALMRVCDVHNVPLATNRATARTILAHFMALGRGQNHGNKGGGVMAQGKALLWTKDSGHPTGSPTVGGALGGDPQLLPVLLGEVGVD
jgi:methylglyoxal synthase